MSNEIKLKYDRFSDALYIKLKEGKIIESEEIAPEIIVDYDEHDEIIGIEVLSFSKKKIDLHKLLIEGLDAVVEEM